MRKWLVDRRKNRGMTQMDIAAKAGISRAYYTQLETGQRDPSIKVAIRLAEILDLEWTWFYEKHMTSRSEQSAYL
ncbi:MAG TPA: transcriptional regulator [Clostridiales bacterium]|nr:transcriptional regulator [Clostridiales bacterium]